MNLNYEEFLELKKNIELKSEVKILTGSMQPLIYPGDIIPFKKYQGEELIKLDILIFWQNNTLICHFFLKEKDDVIITRALASTKCDEPISRDNILGIVTEPKLSWIKKLFLQIIIR